MCDIWDIVSWQIREIILDTSHNANALIWLLLEEQMKGFWVRMSPAWEIMNFGLSFGYGVLSDYDSHIYAAMPGRPLQTVLQRLSTMLSQLQRHWHARSAVNKFAEDDASTSLQLVSSVVVPSIAAQSLSW